MVAAIILVGAVAGINLLLTLVVIRSLNERQPFKLTGLQPGEPVPEFKAQTLEGTAKSLSSFSQRRTVFVFVGPSCQPCREALPEYARLSDLARTRGAELVVVSNGDALTTQEMLGQYADRILTLIAGSGLLAGFKVPATPHFVEVSNDTALASGPPRPTFAAWQQLVAEWEGTGAIERPEALATSR